MVILEILFCPLFYHIVIIGLAEEPYCGEITRDILQIGVGTIDKRYHNTSSDAIIRWKKADNWFCSSSGTRA